MPARFAPRIAQHTIHPQAIFRKRAIERCLAGLPPSVLRIKALVHCNVGESYRLPRAKVSIAAPDALRRRALEHHVAAALG